MLCYGSWFSCFFDTFNNSCDITIPYLNKQVTNIQVIWHMRKWIWPLWLFGFWFKPCVSVLCNGTCFSCKSVLCNGTCFSCWSVLCNGTCFSYWLFLRLLGHVIEWYWMTVTNSLLTDVYSRRRVSFSKFEKKNYVQCHNWIQHEHCTLDIHNISQIHCYVLKIKFVSYLV